MKSSTSWSGVSKRLLEAVVDPLVIEPAYGPFAYKNLGPGRLG